ncbi:MAG: lysoplasmalogenase [Defluviitaleaceae bacterium]|nr:lysoplasmalogenase [Defluviitaleaceae bacterium]
MEIKFTLVVICFLLALSHKSRWLNERDWLLLVLAMAFTVGADFFLTILFNYPVGVAVFCFAHVFYAFRYGGNRVWRFFPLALPLPITLLILTGEPLLVVSSLYAGLFVISLTTAIRTLATKKYPAPNNVLVVAGMGLFVICDVFVAIFNLVGMGFIANHALGEFAVDAIWLFYAPAQICLALSGTKFARKKPTSLCPSSLSPPLDACPSSSSQ